MHDIPVKSLFAKIMLAQVVAVVLALAVVMIITRLSLDRGFMNFLERQESGVLNHLAPALADVYVARGGWDFLRERPEAWHRILRRSGQVEARPEPGGSVRRNPGRPRAVLRPGPEGPEEKLRWLRTFDRLGLRERLFLLDETRQPLAGAHAGHAMDHRDGIALQAIVVEDETVGWIGFVPVRRDLPFEVRRFLRGQVRAHALALGIALALVAVLAYALARHLSQPVARLDDTVGDLTHGDFTRRAEISGGDEIGRLGQNVNRLAETLEKNRSARHRWMTDIAHELRTPVSVLKGEIEALRDGLRPANQDAFASLSEEIDQLSRLVDDLQALALADAGALGLQRQQVDLRELAEQSAESHRGRLAERGIELEVVAPKPAAVSADPQRIRQLLNNLLENCYRYVETGGRVRILLDQAGADTTLTIEDSGPGVPVEAMERLFERFFRDERGRSRAGSGLGLAICRGIAEAHGGSMAASPSSLGGLAIRLTLPD